MTDSEWIYEYQKLITNVLYWINTGKTETASTAILEMKQRWADAINNEAVRPED